MEKGGGGIGKGPRDGNRTRVAVSAVALYVSALTTRLLAPTFLKESTTFVEQGCI